MNKSVRDTIAAVQEALAIPIAKRAPRIGPLTRGAFELLATMPIDAPFNGPVVQNTDTAALEPLHLVRELSKDGEELIKSFEGLYLKAYDDGGGVQTIGWGHTGLQHNDGTVKPGRVITREKAQELFLYDMRQFQERVSSLVDVPLEQREYDALVSFDFNTGGLTLEGGKPSTLLRLLNANDKQGALAEFPKWNKDNGKVIAGLTRRRKAEANMFVGKEWRNV